MNDENTPVGNLLTLGVKAGAGEAGQLSPQKKKKRRRKILLLVVLIAAVIIGIDAAARYRPVYVHQWLKSHVNSPGLPEYHFYVSDIVSIFDKYGAEAVEFFENRNVCVMGVVAYKDITIFDIGAIRLVPYEATAGGAKITCYMKKSNDYNPRIGESIAVYGECFLSSYSHSLVLDDCTIAR